MAATTESAAEGAVTLAMINELQQQVLDNNPIYKYLLSDVSAHGSVSPRERIADLFLAV